MNKELVPFIPHDFGSEEILSLSTEPTTPRNMAETRAVRELGTAIGFGRLMQLAQQEWRRIVAPDGFQGSEHSIGPCVIMTYVCGCRLNDKVSCDWCKGAGWLTKKVRELQIASGE